MEGVPALFYGSGVESFAIPTNGAILACPIAVNVSWARLGHISKTGPEELGYRLKVGEPCVSCRLFKPCNGRSLYTHFEML
ncbi:MAG: hypothetical protein DRJ33_08115 [Candidatus Methanomethylicota archaeon]|uniref:4Fe4S-binding SPASM domain-containing protein n=1 Tax=Thermoproteota archaeon TaxID=2056631 RepID=A0A497ERB8_9CREN|nr:MAG: hypothetical protein DRJ33_08115 [Candidatus Verstraetearchaeota archaeon]